MIRFLLNPGSGGGKGIRSAARLQELAEGAGGRLQVSTCAADLTEKARQAVEEGVERLVVAGGDGTFHYAIQGLAGSECLLGLVPLGRGNDLARAVGAPPDLAAAVEQALTAPARCIDLLRVDRRYGATYCGLGFDSEVTHFANDPSRRVGGALVYPYSVLRTLIGFEPPTLRVEHDEGVFEGRAMFVTVANGPAFGGGMKIAPAAEIDDGLLDLVIVHRVPRRTLLAVFPKVYRGTHVGHPAITILRTRRVRIATDRPLSLYSDGEPVLEVGSEGVEAEVVPGALRVAAGRR